MPDLSDLHAEREKLSARLAAIEAAWTDIVESVAQADAEIAEAKKARAKLVESGKRIRSLLVEMRAELERHDAMIKAAIDEIADRHIGDRQGAYLMSGGMVIARTRVNGHYYTAFVELYDSS